MSRGHEIRTFVYYRYYASCMWRLSGVAEPHEGWLISVGQIVELGGASVASIEDHTAKERLLRLVSREDDHQHAVFRSPKSQRPDQWGEGDDKELFQRLFRTFILLLGQAGLSG